VIVLHLQGGKDFPPPSPYVWSKLSDARFLVQCIPDVESVSVSEPGKVVCTIRPGFAFVRGTLELTVQVAETVPETSIRLLLHTKGIGSTSDVVADLTFSPLENGTRMHWMVEIKSLGGLLKAIPQGLIKASAQKVIGDAMTAVETKLGD
jgi:carbon monoxide dehydrogenase subunit G